MKNTEELLWIIAELLRSIDAKLADQLILQQQTVDLLRAQRPDDDWKNQP